MHADERVAFFGWQRFPQCRFTLKWNVDHWVVLPRSLTWASSPTVDHRVLVTTINEAFCRIPLTNPAATPWSLSPPASQQKKCSSQLDSVPKEARPKCRGERFNHQLIWPCHGIWRRWQRGLTSFQRQVSLAGTFLRAVIWSELETYFIIASNVLPRQSKALGSYASRMTIPFFGNDSHDWRGFFPSSCSMFLAISMAAATWNMPRIVSSKHVDAKDARLTARKNLAFASLSKHFFISRQWPSF